MFQAPKGILLLENPVSYAPAFGEQLTERLASKRSLKLFGTTMQILTSRPFPFSIKN